MSPRRRASSSGSQGNSRPQRGSSPPGSPPRIKPSRHKSGGQPKNAPRQNSSEPGKLQRLQRVLAAAGFGSRRQCEELIEAGRVVIDGETVTKLGTTVDPAGCKISVDGIPLKKQKLVYYAVNKPSGVVTTNSDPQGRPRVIDLVPPSERVFPVGRLDRSSEGLILLTNDGELAQRLAHPKFGIQKVYRVTVAGKLDPETMRQMRRGIYIAEGHVRVDGARILRTRGRATELEIVLREGKNREIRRILARLGHKVQQLRRIAIGPLKLGSIPAGAYHALTRTEVQKLQHAADEAERSGGDRKASAKQASPSKQATGKKRGTPRTAAKARPAARAKPRPSRPSANEIPVDSVRDRPKTLGAVIGGDPQPAAKPKKRAAGKPTAKRSGSKQRAAGPKRATKKRKR